MSIKRGELQRVVMESLIASRDSRELVQALLDEMSDDQIERVIASEHLGCEDSAPSPVISQAINLIATQLHNGDSIRLQGISEEGKSYVRRWGQWWKVHQVNTRDHWLATNYPHSKQGRFGGDRNDTTVIKILKDGTDPNYKIVDRIVFPQIFLLADYKGE